MRLRKNVAVSESGFIFNPSTGDSFSANQAALLIVESLKEQISISEIIEQISREYEVNDTQLAEDMDDFIGHLRQLGLIENE